MKIDLLLFISLMLGSSQSQISFYEGDRIQTLPDTSLQSVTILEFALLPVSLQPENFTSTWILPSGEIVSVLSQSADRSTRFIVQEGSIPVNQNHNLQGTLLIIQGLSYLDAGVYTCRVQDNNNPSSPPIEATVELRLLLSLTAIDTSVLSLDNACSVSLTCVMRDYIRPDDQLQWLKDGKLITSGQNRRSISFTNGTINRGQIGGLFFVPSRLSTLTISNPILSDSGTYSCRVMGTPKSVDIELLVQHTSIKLPPLLPKNTTIATSSSSSILSDPLTSILIGLTLAFFMIALVAVGISIVVCVVKKGKQKDANTLWIPNESLQVNELRDPAGNGSVTHNSAQEMDGQVTMTADPSSMASHTNG